MNWKNGAEQFLQALCSADPTPGGGAAAALAGAMGCALGLMAVNTTLKRKSTPDEHKVRLQQGQNKLAGLQAALKALMAKDADAYASFITARQLPKENPAREQAMQDALWFAATVPADTATTCQYVIKELAGLQPFIAPIILSDVACAHHLLKSAIACCAENIRINMAGITQPEKAAKLAKQLEDLKTVIQL